MPLEITLLGCGPSGGVPLIGCACATCRSPDPRNRRSRASLLVESADTRLLFDTSPDLRQQALNVGITSVDAIFYTHTHADHCHGIDDARAFNYHGQRAIPAYATAASARELRERFAYAFQAPAGDGAWFRPALELQEIQEYDAITVGNLKVLNYLQHHGKSHSTGYRIENIAYSPDVHKFPQQSLQLLEKLDLWIVDCLRPESAPSHAHLALTLEWIAHFSPKMAVLTHMGHALEYGALAASLPPHIVPGYDGMRIRVEEGQATIIG